LCPVQPTQPVNYVLRSYGMRSIIWRMAKLGDRRVRRSNEPPLLILMSLADGSKHGHALAKDIEAFAGVSLGPGALYGAITRLEERGMIEALPSTDRRRPYRITSAGSAALAEAVAEMRQLADVGAARLGTRSQHLGLA
jgi:DNA-binding PadR family transcriptional regulator